MAKNLSRTARGIDAGLKNMLGLRLWRMQPKECRRDQQWGREVEESPSVLRGQLSGG